MAVIFVASSRTVPAPVSQVPDWISHAVAYALLSVLLVRAMAGGLGEPAPLALAARAVVAAFLYGVTDEFHQSFVPGRHADPADLIKNLGGAVLGAGACAAAGGFDRRRKAA
jgi:VanZ family protein